MILSKIVVPRAGVSVKKCKLARWHVADSERVQKADLIATLETKKISYELEAGCSGILHHGASEGEWHEIHSEIGYIEHDGLEVVEGTLRLSTEINSSDLALLDERRGSESRDEFLLKSLRMRLSKLDVDRNS